MMERRSSWIKKDTRINLYQGKEEKYGWQIYIHVSKQGVITTKKDKPIITFEEPVKTKYRSRDRGFFVRVCGKEYMKDKEVDHQWGNEPIWTRVVSPMQNGGRTRVQSYSSESFVENEEWLQELYPGKRQ